MYYEFYCPVKIISGDNAVFNLPNELERLRGKKPLILTDEGVEKAGIIEHFVKSAFEDANMKLPAVFDKIPVESSITAVEKAQSFFKTNDCDSIIAVGGGSVIDSAKVLNMLIAENKISPIDIVGVDILKNKGKPFIVLPTTSGTGSEATSVAVIYDENSGSKLAFSSHYLMPDCAVLDPELVLSMPAKLTASSGIDALSHAIEAYIGIQKNPLSRALAFNAVNIILNNLQNAVKDGKNKQIRFELMNASVMAGMAFSNSMVGIVHSMAHAAGSVLHIPHGIAVSYFLIPGLEENLEASKSDLSELLKAVPYLIETRGSKIEKARQFIYFIKKFIEETGRLAHIPASLNDYGFSDEHIDKIVDLAIKDGSSIFSKVALHRERALRMLKKTMKQGL